MKKLLKVNISFTLSLKFKKKLYAIQLIESFQEYEEHTLINFL
jgi:hypothetical protein